MMQWLCKRLGIVTKYDLNEYSRRFLAGDDLLDLGGDYTPETAMRISAVYACVRVLAGTIASLPVRVYRDRSGGGTEAAGEHPVHDLLYQRPNRYHSPFEYFEQMVAHLCLRGNHIALKLKEGGRVTQLVPVHPSRVVLEEYDNALVYRVTLPRGQQLRLLSEDVLHVRWLTTDGYWGQSPVGQAKEAFDLARRVQKYGISVFESGGAKRVVIKYPHALDPTSAVALREAWERVGKDSARAMVLDDNGDAVTVGMNADEAQYLETRQMTVADIARIYGVPLILLNVHEKTASYASTEQFDIMYAKHTIRPWLKRIEAALDRDLLGDTRFYCKFNMDALLRGDVKTRTEACQIQFMNGALTLDQWCELENRDPVGGEAGRTHFVPSNLIPAERALERPAPAEAPTPAGGIGGPDNEPAAPKAARPNLEPIARDIAARLVRAEVRDLPRARDIEEFRTRQRVYAYQAMEPLFAAAGCEEEERRERLATRIVATLAAGREVDVENRQKEITALLLGAITQDVVESARWHVAAVAARRALELAVAGSEKSPDPGGGTT